jgi:hypothetical protein
MNFFFWCRVVEENISSEHYSCPCSPCIPSIRSQWRS